MSPLLNLNEVTFFFLFFLSFLRHFITVHYSISKDFITAKLSSFYLNSFISLTINLHPMIRIRVWTLNETKAWFSWKIWFQSNNNFLIESSTLAALLEEFLNSFVVNFIILYIANLVPTFIFLGDWRGKTPLGIFPWLVYDIFVLFNNNIELSLPISKLSSFQGFNIDMISYVSRFNQNFKLFQ